MAKKENGKSKPTSVLSLTAAYPLHQLGWKAFQDLAVGIAEECLRRPVQTFLPSRDAGRDGAFVGKWEGDDTAAGQSTIQCKFTSKPGLNLTVSMLADEAKKAKRLAAKGLAQDYIILTNHPVTGESELAIKAAFESVGVGTCRIFGSDWITRQIQTSPRLRIMAPRLYGLGDLNDVLDGRAYEQAQMILSAMGEDLQRLVVTEAHRRSVRAISKHNMVLLLGAPAAGKSTIGASIAVGAADIWQSGTIRATSPEDVRRHISTTGSQFFWIDDAWGNTQYQRQTAEQWNQVFPLMQGAMKLGTRFLITSRDYIWRAAQADLKLQAMPTLRESQVIINVEELTVSERAQILYNHLKLGDQPTSFKKAIKPFLPIVAELKGFLPETARRLGSTFFAKGLPINEAKIVEFVQKPQQFLLETITNLADDCRAAIAVIFLNGGTVRSPVASSDLSAAAGAFGVTEADVRKQLQALNGSLLLLAQNDSGPYWTYKHPTVSDAFAKYLAATPEMVELYLRGARPYSILYEVVCAGCRVDGAALTIPDSLHSLLLERIISLEVQFLKTFVSYRSNKAFALRLLEARPDLLQGLRSFYSPIKDDSDARLLITLHEQKLLSEELRASFVTALLDGLEEYADASVFQMAGARGVLTKQEYDEALRIARDVVFRKLGDYVEKVRTDWNSDYDPENHFDDLQINIDDIKEAVIIDDPMPLPFDPMPAFRSEVRKAVEDMEPFYTPASSTAAPVASSTPQNAVLHTLFRDLDE